MESNELTQVEMPLQTVDLAVVLRQSNLAGAVALCASLSGKDDKQLYMDLGIDPGQWSRIMKGSAHFPLNKLSALMDLCGNEAPLMWLIHHRGWDVATLRRQQSETERALEAERQRTRELEAKLQHVTEFFREARTA